MKSHPLGFPLIVGLKVTENESISESSFTAIRDLFIKLREQSSFGVLLVHWDPGERAAQVANAAREAGIAYRTREGRTWSEAVDTAAPELTSANMELVETSDVLVLVAALTSQGENISENDLVSYAKGVGRPVIRFDVRTGRQHGDIPERVEPEDSWLAELFETAGLPPDSDLNAIKLKMSAVSKRLSMVTRRWWNWTLLLQALAVLIPIGWLVRRPLDIQVQEVALMTLCAVILLAALSWWLRWRGMQKTWARSRLVVEHARSLLATSGCPRMPALQSLATVPAIRPLRWVSHDPPQPTSFAEWRDLYVRDRVDDQLQYFHKNQKQAETQRKRLTRWATLLLDVTLAFAFAGAVIAFAPHNGDWIRKLGDTRLEIILGIAGVLMPLGLLLVQVLRNVQDLNRRAARFAQQNEMLQQARARLTSVSSPEPAMEIIEDTERQLLGEVLEWYFHAETAEHFFQMRTTRERAPKLKTSRSNKHPSPNLSMMALGKVGIAGFFILRVILGRVPWIVASGAAALTWVMYHEPGDLKSRNELKVLAVLKNKLGETWDPTNERAEHGCVIIVHGLHGHSLWTAQKNDWMQKSADEIEKRMAAFGVPNICLVDWEGVATPSKIYNGVEIETARMLGDVAAIREQAYQVGDQLGVGLALRLADGTIHKDRPLHLIGHSAGGFVVARAVRRLTQLRVAPALLSVTILDTPAPDNEVLFDLPAKCPTDFYITSFWGGRTPSLLLADFSAPNMHMKQYTPPAEKKSALDQHLWAYTWFIETITNSQKWPNEGFNRSSLLKASQEIQ